MRFQVSAFDVEGEVVDLGNTAVDGMGPIAIIVVTAFLGLAILAWALRKLWRMYGHYVPVPTIRRD